MNRFLAVSSFVAIVAVAAAVCPDPSSAEDTGVISGRVVNEKNGNGIANVRIQTRDADGLAATPTRTDDSGHYVVEGLPAGSYFLSTFNVFGFRNELYDDIPCIGGVDLGGCDPTTGTPVEVVPGETTTGIDFALTPLGRITGRVTDARTGQPIPSVTVEFFLGTSYKGSETTDADGGYRSRGLAPGTYFVRTVNSLGYLDELYAGKPCPYAFSCDASLGTPLEVGLDQTLVLDFALDFGGSISGRFLDEVTGKPVGSKLGSGMVAGIWNAQGERLGGFAVASNGTYKAFGLEPGTYFATAENVQYSEAYVEEVYADIPCFQGVLTDCDPTAGTPIEVALATEVPDVDFALQRNGSITGTVVDSVLGQPIYGAVVVLRDASGQRIRATITDEKGRYTTPGQNPGTVFLTVSSPYYRAELYQDVPCPLGDDACDLNAGRPIDIDVASIVSGVDFALDPVGGITGRVTDEATGTPLRNVAIDAWKGSFRIERAITDAGGRYFLALPPSLFGDRYFLTTDNQRGAVDELYDDLPCTGGPASEVFCNPTSGTPIELAENEIREGVDFALAGAQCIEDAATMCLNGNRFRVEVTWETRSGATGSGQAIELTDDSGYFWFFQSANVELVIKVLDGCFEPFDTFWIFAAGLTDVGVEITVTDTWTREVKTYANPVGRAFEPILDTHAFATCDAQGPASTAKAAGGPRLAGGEKVAKAITCYASDTNLCLNQDRFRVEATWRTPAGKTGEAQAVPLTRDTGYLWFFAADNVEAIVKVLDACELQGFHSYWVFAAGLTNVEVTLRVTDTVTGDTNDYFNPLGQSFAPILDLGTFATCP